MTLQETRDYFKDLAILLTSADNPVLDEVDEEMNEELKRKTGQIDRHVRTLHQNAEKIEWEDEANKQEYLQEIDNCHSKLQKLKNIDPSTPVDNASDLYEYARTLQDDADGLLEDLK